MAAIASEEAGRLYGLKVLRRNVEDQQNNYTRFLVVCQEARSSVDLRIPCKTSLVMATSHEEGSLLKALSLLHEYKINLSKLESRPIPGMPFQYLFYIDFEGNAAERQVAEALEKLRSATTSLKVLGSYPTQHRAKTSPTVEMLAEPAPAPDTEPPGTCPQAKRKRSATDWPAANTSRTTRSSECAALRSADPDFVVIAGPCAVESRGADLQVRAGRQGMRRRNAARRVLQAAHLALQFPGTGLRGAGNAGGSGREYDLPIVTEVLSPADVEPVARYADILQIGARNMQNFSLLSEVGRIQPARAAEARHDVDDGRIPERGRVHPRPRQSPGHSVRTRHPDVRDRHAQHAGSRIDSDPQATDASADPGRSVPRRRARELVIPLAMAAHAVGSARHDCGNAPGTGKGPERRPAGAATSPEFADLMRRIYRIG